MTRTLNTKQASGYTTDEGTVVPAHNLYRYTDENGEGGCWYSTLAQAETSWQRWVENTPARESRRTESARLRAAFAAADEQDDSDPFARFDA